MQDYFLRLRTVLLRLLGRVLPQKWVKLGVVLVAPVLMISVLYLLPGSGDSSQAARSGLPAIHEPQDVANMPYDYQFIGQGQITGGSEEVWIIGNVPIRVAAQTQLASELHVGDFVVLTGRILQDKTWLADRIQLTQEDETYFTFNGPLEMIQESLWQIGGHSLVVDQQTEVGDKLELGQILLTTFTAPEDSTWIAMKILAFDEFPAPPVTILAEEVIPTPAPVEFGVAAPKITNNTATADKVKINWADLDQKEKEKSNNGNSANRDHEKDEDDDD